MQILTDHEKKILELVKKHPEIVDNRSERERIAKTSSMTEKTLRNRIADLKRYGLVDSKGASIKETSKIAGCVNSVLPRLSFASNINFSKSIPTLSLAPFKISFAI